MRHPWPPSGTTWKVRGEGARGRSKGPGACVNWAPSGLACRIRALSASQRSPHSSRNPVYAQSTGARAVGLGQGTTRSRADSFGTRCSALLPGDRRAGGEAADLAEPRSSVAHPWDHGHTQLVHPSSRVRVRLTGEGLPPLPSLRSPWARALHPKELPIAHVQAFAGHPTGRCSSASSMH